MREIYRKAGSFEPRPLSTRFISRACGIGLSRNLRTMEPNDWGPRCVDGRKPPNKRPTAVNHYYKVLAQPPHLSKLPTNSRGQAKVEALNIQVEDSPDGFVRGFLHLPPDFARAPPGVGDGDAGRHHNHHHRAAAILLSGAGGGVCGPSAIYLSLAAKLAALGPGMPVLRLDCRRRGQDCAAADVRRAMDRLQDAYGLDLFVLAGWSAGGSAVFAVGGSDDRVVGCAAVASQAAADANDGIRRLSPTPVLLLHGTADRTVGTECSRRLFDAYGDGGTRRLHLFDGDDHALTGNAKTAEAMLLDFIAGCANLWVDDAEKESVAGKDLVRDNERIMLMKRGGDLRGAESIS